MDRLLATLSSKLPAGYGSSEHVQRQSSFFGRFCEKMVGRRDIEDDDGFLRGQIQAACEMLGKDDDELRDPSGSLLRGLTDTLAYIAMLRPDLFQGNVQGVETEIPELSDLVGGRIALLARSKRPGNVISYLAAMTAFAPLIAEPISLLLGNSLVKCLQQFNIEAALDTVILDVVLKLIRHGDPSVRCNAWRFLAKLSMGRDDAQIRTIRDAFAKERNLDVVEAALPTVGGLTDMTESLDGLMDHLVRANLCHVHPILFRKLLKMNLMTPDRLAQLPLDLPTLRHAVMWSELHRCGYWPGMKIDQILVLLTCLLKSNNPDVIYAGLLLLKESFTLLGADILKLQAVLSELYHSEDNMIVLRVLEIFFLVANAENWTRILETALKQPISDVLVWMRILNLSSQLILQLGVEDETKVDRWLTKVLNLVPESASMEEVGTLVEIIGAEKIERLEDLCSTRVLVIAGVERDGDANYTLQKRLIQSEIAPLFNDDPHGSTLEWFDLSAQDDQSTQTASMHGAKIESVEIEGDVDVANIFASFSFSGQDSVDSV